MAATASASAIYNRLVYVALVAATIGLGLIVHFQGEVLGPTAHDVAGDAIWAAMITWCVSVVVPRRSLRVRSVVAVTICFAVELSQLYHAPVLDAFRRTAIGRLALGSGFDPRDLVAYVTGVLAVVLVERTKRGQSTIFRRRRQSTAFRCRRRDV